MNQLENAQNRHEKRQPSGNCTIASSRISTEINTWEALKKAMLGVPENHGNTQ